MRFCANVPWGKEFILLKLRFITLLETNLQQTLLLANRWFEDDPLEIVYFRCKLLASGKEGATFQIGGQVGSLS